MCRKQRKNFKQFGLDFKSNGNITRNSDNIFVRVEIDLINLKLLPINNA